MCSSDAPQTQTESWEQEECLGLPSSWPKVRKGGESNLSLSSEPVALPEPAFGEQEALSRPERFRSLQALCNKGAIEGHGKD